MAQKKLAWGYTTGTCAQAATKAALKMLFVKEQIDQIEVELPKGKKLQLKIHDIRIEYRDENQKEIQSISCAVQKDSGDDPDITNGIMVYSKVEKTNTGQYILDGGQGIGRVTKPGLDQPVGNAAINRVPRKMILQEVEDACEEVGYLGGIYVEISIPEGKRLAAKTFNPRLGIEGGLSILGTSGLVEPMSEQALLDTICLDIRVKMAAGKEYLIAAPGNYGLDFLRQAYGIEEQEVVKCSNYIGQTIDMAIDQGSKGILLVGHIGKLIKVAGGIMNTHSRWADCRMEILAAAALKAGVSREKTCEFLDCMTTDDALDRCTLSERERIMGQIMERMEQYLNYRAAGELQIGAITFSNIYGILGKTSQAEHLIEKYKVGVKSV